MTSEKSIQDGILKWLRKTFPRAVVYKIHEDPVFGSVGLPDIYFAWDGNQHWFEVKRPGEHPSPIQKVVHEKMKSNRVSVHVVTSLDQVKTIVTMK